MSDRQRGLGRGLGALIPQGPMSTGDARSASLPQPSAPSPVDVLIPGRASLTVVTDPLMTPDSSGAHEPGGARGTGARPSDAQERSSEEAGVGGAETPDADLDPPATTPADAQRVADDSDSFPGPAGAAAYFREVPVGAVVPNPRQPRQVFDEDELAELVSSIKEVGLLQPVVVRPLAGDRFELVMGERRWRAGIAAGMETIPAIVRATDDAHLLRDALLENLHRSQLNPLEEAAAYDQMLRDFGCSHDELAQRIGRSRPQISNTLRLLRLPPLVQRRVAAGVLSAGHARALVGLEDSAAQERLAQRIVAEGLSVRAVEEMVALGGVGEDRPPRRPRGVRAVPPEVAAIVTRLSDLLETRVKVDVGKNKGKIVVEFASVEDLDRILSIIAPDDGSSAEAQSA